MEAPNGKGEDEGEGFVPGLFPRFHTTWSCTLKKSALKNHNPSRSARLYPSEPAPLSSSQWRRKFHFRRKRKKHRRRNL